MKTAAIGLLLLAAWSAAGEENFEVTRFALNGGTSTGGVYSLTGTLGCTESARMAGGNYAVAEGGYTHLLARLHHPRLLFQWSSPTNLTGGHTAKHSIFSVPGRTNASLQTIPWPILYPQQGWA